VRNIDLFDQKITDNFFIGNRAAYGGAIAINSSTINVNNKENSVIQTNNFIYLTGNYFINNTATKGIGGAIDVTMFPDDLQAKKITLNVDGGRNALFYGNKAVVNGENAYSAIGVSYGSKFNNYTNLHKEAFILNVGNALMLDPIYAKGQTLINGTGRWYLGGSSVLDGGLFENGTMFNVQSGGQLILTNVNYGDGFKAASIKALAKGTFTLATGATLRGSGVIDFSSNAANKINIYGNIVPTYAQNIGLLASKINPNTSKKDLSTIGVKEVDHKDAQITLKGNVDWHNYGSGVNALKIGEQGDFKGKIFIDGNLVFKGSNNLYLMSDSDTDALIGKHSIKTNIYSNNSFTNDFVVASSHSFLDLESNNNNKEQTHLTFDYTYNGLKWNSTRLDANNKPIARGTFDVIYDRTFTINSVLADKNANANWDGKSLTKIGTGTLVLKGKNTYTDLTNVAQGTLSVKDNGQIAGDVKIYTTNMLSGKRELDLSGNAKILGNLKGFKNGYDSYKVSMSDKAQIVGNVYMSNGYLEVKNNAVIGGELLLKNYVNADLKNNATVNGNALVGFPNYDSGIAELIFYDNAMVKGDVSLYRGAIFFKKDSKAKILGNLIVDNNKSSQSAHISNDSLEIIKVGGNLDLYNNGIASKNQYAVTINGDDSHSKMLIDGKAILSKADGTDSRASLYVALLNFVQKIGSDENKTYTIIEAKQGVEGKFHQVNYSNSYAFITPTVTYSANKVDVKLELKGKTPTPPTPPGGGVTPPPTPPVEVDIDDCEKTTDYGTGGNDNSYLIRGDYGEAGEPIKGNGSGSGSGSGGGSGDVKYPDFVDNSIMRFGICPKIMRYIKKC